VNVCFATAGARRRFLIFRQQSNSRGRRDFTKRFTTDYVGDSGSLNVGSRSPHTIGRYAHATTTLVPMQTPTDAGTPNAWP
jgi:hypothetical protein